MTLVVTPASLEDADAIARVHVESWQEAYRSLLPAGYLASLSIEQRAATWRRSLESGTPRLLVARHDGELVGFIAFGPSRDEGAAASCGEVWALYLAPSMWSRGAGRRLWLAALNRMLDQGCETVSLWVIATNERAIRFYRAAGFRADAASLKEFTLGGVALQEIRHVFHRPD